VLSYRWLHPISLLLYNFSFRSEPPSGHVAWAFRNASAGRTATDLQTLVDEVTLELAEPTQSVREINQSPQTEADCRAFLSAVVARLRGRINVLAQLRATPELTARTITTLERHGDAFCTNNAAAIADALRERLLHAAVWAGRSGWKDGNPIAWNEAVSFDTWVAEIEAAIEALRKIDFAAHAARYPFDAQHERHQQLSVTPRCTACDQVATTILLTQRHAGWNFQFRGICGDNGDGDIVDDARAALIQTALTPPHTHAKIRQAGFYDDAGFCGPCETFYCRAHWHVSKTGGGHCPAGHFKSLDPHWSPD
jgi:hypothetical protein